MAAMLETPSRVWRRIEAIEGQDMPSLPSLPVFEDSADQISESNDESSIDLQEAEPIHSTPAALSSHTQTTIRAPSSTSSTARFAQSIASRSTKSSISISRGSVTKQTPQESFDISSIPSLPDMNHDGRDIDIRSSDQDTTESSIPEVYSPPVFAHDALEDVDADLDISDALRSVSRPNSPDPMNGPTPQKKYDYSVSLRSEQKPSPFEKMRNVSFRRPLSRTRTPSLTHTTPSPSSSSSHSTPRSVRSIAFPRSATASPLPALSVPLPPSTNVSPAATPQAPEERAAHEDPADITLSETEDGLSREEMDLTDTLPRGIETSEQQSDDNREPTFSSSEAPTHSEHDNEVQDMQSPIGLSVAFSSPAPSAIFTPTPAFHPRPRARFAVGLPLSTPRPPQQLPQHTQDQPYDEGLQEYDGEDLATPHAHKRSFLLSVINSTARPRLKYPTPHPQRGGDGQQIRAPMTPGVNLQAAFAGVTPRPQMRPRPSHTLVQTLPAPSEAGSTSSSELASASLSPGQAESILPGAQSPYDPTMDRASFVSTASSHDLTTHARANASFDPAIGLGDRGHGVGRFNAGKLNNYLHGLNRRLQEENETLVFRLRTYEEKYGKAQEAEHGTTPDVSQREQPPQSRRSSAGSRRVSIGPSVGLNDVAEDVAEGWMEEKAAMEDMMEDLRGELQRSAEEKQKAEEALAQDKNERARDKERWRERMTDVEKGVSEIIQGLEEKLGQAEEAARQKTVAMKELERKVTTIVAEKDMFEERASKAEAALESGRELGAELNATTERVAQVMGDLRKATEQIRELEDEVMNADQKLDNLELQLRDEKEANAGLEEELSKQVRKLAESSDRVETLEEDLRSAQGQLRQSQEYSAQLGEDAAMATHRIDILENQLADAQDRIEDLMSELDRERDEVDQLSGQANKASELARQMEEALEAAEAKMIDDEQEVIALKAKVAALEQVAERQQEQSRVTTGSSREPTTAELQDDIDALEAELVDAHREIARLNTLVSQSPARKAIDRAKDAKIELLEKEREDLLDRVKSMKAQNSFYATPGKAGITSGLSPLHRQMLSMRSPKTPGGPLRDLSWLQSTMKDPSVSPLVAEIARLQHELELANESVDDKLDKLEDAGLGIVGLTKQLEDSREKIRALEDTLARLSRRDERRHVRLRRARCLRCRSKVDLHGLEPTRVGDESSILDDSIMSLASEPPTPPTRTSEALRVNLAQVNAQLSTMREAWKQEKHALLGENAVLQDTANRLNAEIRDAKNQVKKLVETGRAGEKARATIQEELDKARRAIDDMEAELKTERTRLRTMTTDQSRSQRDKDEVLLQLRRTESDMNDVKEHLQRLKQENHELEGELRSNAMAEQKARLLETRVAENAATIEQLRQERSMLTVDHKQLQSHYSRLSDHMNKLKEEYAASQTSHDERRHQLDLRLLEIEDLRRALSEHEDELQRAEIEKKRVNAEKSDIAQSVEALEADLRRVRRDAEAFGRDLKLLRAQKDRLEEERKQEKTKTDRAHKQSQAQIRLLKEELDGQREKAKTADEQFKSHVCPVDQQQLANLKLKHNKECKGLIVQIRYLKAKFTRESSWRCDLGYQKSYLLVLLAQYERSEQKIVAAIARIGFPAPEPPPRRRTLKTVVTSVLFILRAKRASDAWREQSAAKEAVTAALEEVRRQRAASGKRNNRQ